MMQNAEKDPNLNSSSFTTTSEGGEGDSLSSFQSSTTPGCSVDLQTTSLDVSTSDITTSNEEYLDIRDELNSDNLAVSTEPTENLAVSDIPIEGLNVGTETQEKLTVSSKKSNDENLRIVEESGVENRTASKQFNEANLIASEGENVVVKEEIEDDNLVVKEEPKDDNLVVEEGTKDEVLLANEESKDETPIDNREFQNENSVVSEEPKNENSLLNRESKDKIPLNSCLESEDENAMITEESKGLIVNNVSANEKVTVSNDPTDQKLTISSDENLNDSNFPNEDNLAISNDVNDDVNDENLVVCNDENLTATKKCENVKANAESKSSVINVFEEDACSSWSEEPKQTEFKETVIDESSRNSINSHKSSKKHCSDDEGNKRDFPPENLFEYMWPQDNGEFFILQEQICDYLNVKSFKRKYPDLIRRTVDMDEKRFLREKGVVTEMQCDLGLTALRSEDVLELMSKDYPDHYKEYIKVLREKEKQSINEKQKEFAATSADKNKMIDLVKKAVQSAAEYNAHLNQERREERRSCMDLQTFTIHYPVKNTNKVRKYTKPGKYPVALLPGQFQDYYKEYTPGELKYLPVNTVLYGPLKELNTLKALSDGSQSDSDDSTASEGSCSSSQGTHDDSSSGSEKTDVNKKTAMPASPYRPKIKPNAMCKVCKTGPEGKIKDGKPEELVHCSECENSSHPSCIGLTVSVVNVLKTYPWQCMHCKVCSHCRDPNDEDKMLFCDTCDRGYHTFCVGLKILPQGKWICRQCGCCSSCGVTRPGPESSKTQWQYDTTKVNESDSKNTQPKILCQSCFKKK